MSGRLKAALKRFFDEKGETEALARLSLATGKSVSTIARWIRRGKVPTVLDAREIALQCGFTPEDADALARESVLHGAMKAG